MPWSLADVRIISILPELIICGAGLLILIIGFAADAGAG